MYTGVKLNAALVDTHTAGQVAAMQETARVKVATYCEFLLKTLIPTSVGA